MMHIRWQLLVYIIDVYIHCLLVANIPIPKHSLTKYIGPTHYLELFNNTQMT